MVKGEYNDRRPSSDLGHFLVEQARQVALRQGGANDLTSSETVRQWRGIHHFPPVVSLALNSTITRGKSLAHLRC